MTTQTVFIVDDDEAVRSSLKLLLKTLGLSAVTYASAPDFLAAFEPSQAGCLVLDIRMPGMSGLELQQELNARGALLPIIFITGHGDVPMAVEAMQHGAMDFLQKPFRDQELIDGINRALRKDAEGREAIARVAEVKRRAETLSPREREVMRLVVDGRANKVIAIDLGLSERTVEIHRANVMEKMRAQSVAHLVKMSMLLDDDRNPI